MINSKKAIVIGAGGHARIVLDTLELLDFKITGIIDINFKGVKETIFNHEILGNMDKLRNYSPEDHVVVIAVGDIEKKKELYQYITALGFLMPVIIHPSATVSGHAKISAGTFINSGAVVNAAAEIGENVLINTSAVVEHEVVVGSHCHIAPGAIVAGRTKIGESTFIGAGSILINNISVGSRVTVGAGSVIISDLENESTYVGIPGKKIK